MHVDSRNPQRYEPEIDTQVYKDAKRAITYAYMSWSIKGSYVTYAAYQDLKGKLENLERKYKKLKKRHMDVSRKFREADTKAYLLGFKHGWSVKQND